MRPLKECRGVRQKSINQIANKLDRLIFFSFLILFLFPSSPAGTNGCSPCSRKYVLLCAACGGLAIVLGSLFAVLYVVLRSYTSSLHYFETVPSYVASIVVRPFKNKKKGKKKDPDPVTQIRHSRCKNSTLVCSTKPFRCYSAMLIEPRLMIYRVKFNRAPYITFWLFSLRGSAIRIESKW